MESANKRIAKNTIYLYFRMIILLLVKLYTSRVVLNVLGVDDFGTWNVVAAFVVSFSFISSPLVTATQRFLNYDMGKGGNNLNAIFSTSLLLFAAIGVLIVLILETFGVWFLNHKMNFQEGQMQTVNWIFQFSIVTSLINLIRMPYESTIVAYERMSFYAVICLLEGFLLLGIVFLLQAFEGYDKLILYGAFTLCAQTVICLCYKYYCNKHFPCSHFKFLIEKPLMKEIGSFSGWNLFGALSSMSALQGVNIVINLFWGVVVNAAYGLSSQVSAAVGVLIVNLSKASDPQIVQCYASRQFERVQLLVDNVGKYAYLLVLFFSLPLMFHMDYILYLWLGDKVPEYAASFAIISIVQLMINCISLPMHTAVSATGKIKVYQIVVSLLILMNIVITYVLFSMGFSPVSTMVVRCIIEVLVCIARLTFVKINIGLSLGRFMSASLLPVVSITIVLVLYLYVMTQYIFHYSDLVNLIMTILCYVPVFVLMVSFFAINRESKLKLKNVVVSKLKSCR